MRLRDTQPGPPQLVERLVDAVIDQRGDEAAVDRLTGLTARRPGERHQLRWSERLLRAERPGAAALQRRQPEAIGRGPSVWHAEQGEPLWAHHVEVRLDRRQTTLAEEVLAEPKRHRDVEASLKCHRQREDVSLDRLKASSDGYEELTGLIQREARGIDQRHLGSAHGIERPVEPTARAELDHLQPVETTEMLVDEPLLCAPARRTLLGTRGGRI